MHTLRKWYWRTFKIKTFGVRVIIKKGESIFLVKHRYGNLWVLPGGGIKKVKNAEGAAQREVREEANIEIKKFERILGTYLNTQEGKHDAVTILVAEEKEWEDKGKKWNLEIKESGFLMFIICHQQLLLRRNDVYRNIFQVNKNNFQRIGEYMENKKIILRFRAINKDIFLAIKNGKKKIETRAASKRFRTIKTGDKLVLVCGKEKIERKVKKIKVFKTIKTLLKKYKPWEINPEAFSEKDLIKMWSGFSDYKEKIKKYGLVAMEL